MRTAMKLLVGLALAASLVTPAVPSAGQDQSVLKSFGLSRNFEDYLAKPGAQVPWLDLNTRTKLPNGELPVGRAAAGLEDLALRPAAPKTQLSSNVTASSASGGMMSD